MTRSPGPASSAATSLGSSSWTRTTAVSFSLTAALTRLPSARPCTFGMTSPITLPISLGEVAPDSATASPTIASSSSSESCAGRYEAIDLGLALLGLGRSVAAPVAVGLGGLEAALALALQHLDFLAAVLLGGLLELGHDQAERVHALALARLHGVLHVALDLLEHGHRLQVYVRLPRKPHPSRRAKRTTLS